VVLPADLYLRQAVGFEGPGFAPDLVQAVRALPGYALAQENLGDVYLRMAARAYERAGQLDPRNADSRNKLALARELLAKVAPRAAAASR